MASTTGAVVASGLKLELSTNGTTWTDISGSSNKIDIGGGDRPIETTKLFGGNAPIVTSGAADSIEAKITALYTEVANETWELARAAYEAGSALYVRYSPAGGTTGKFQFASGSGRVKNAVWPSADASDSKPIMFECTVTVPSFTKSTVV